MKSKNFRSLGAVSEEQWNSFEKNRITGPQVKRVFLDEKNLWEEKYMGLDTDLKEFKLRQEFSDSFLKDVFKKAKIDGKINKETFENTIDDFYIANIEGYVGDDIQSIEQVIIVRKRNFEEINLEAAYYMWFFSVKKVKLIIAKDNLDFEVKTFNRVKSIEDEMLEKLSDFKDKIFIGFGHW